MTREETIRLLQFLKGCYPNKQIDDPRGMIDAYMLALSEFKAEDIYKAARFHMVKKKFFPSPAEILENVERARIVYDDKPNNLSSGNYLPSGDEDDLEGWKIWEFIMEDKQNNV